MVLCIHIIVFSYISYFIQHLIGKQRASGGKVFTDSHTKDRSMQSSLLILRLNNNKELKRFYDKHKLPNISY